MADVDYNGKYSPRFGARPIKFWQAYTYEKNPSHRFLAAELEVHSGCQTEQQAIELERLTEKWSASQVSDCYFEINTGPANGDLWPMQICQFINAFKESGITVNGSCGCHVHVDTRDLSLFDIRKVMKVWVIVESTLFKLVAKRRRQCGYCAAIAKRFTEFLAGPLGRSAEEPVLREGLSILTMGDTWAKVERKAKSDKNSWMRNHSFNIRSHFYRGTIECRMLEGTLTPYKIIYWGMLLTGIVDYCKAVPEAEIDSLPNNGLEVLFRMCYTPALRRWLVDTYRKREPDDTEVKYVETQGQVAQAAVQ